MKNSHKIPVLICLMTLMMAPLPVSAQAQNFPSQSEEHSPTTSKSEVANEALLVYFPRVFEKRISKKQTFNT